MDYARPHDPLFMVHFRSCSAGQLSDHNPRLGLGPTRPSVISRVAEKNLTPKARAAIAELLDPGETLADASTWADENRGRLRKTAPWHYVDVPLDER
jgi:hypothetical protein